MVFYTDIAKPARDRALKQIQAQTEEEMDPMGFTTTPRMPIASGPDIPTTQPLPLAPTASSDYTLGPSTSPARPALPLAPTAGLSPELEKFGLQGIYATALETEAASRPQQPMTEAEMDRYGSTIREPAPVHDPRGREKSMEEAAQKAATGGFEGQTIELTREMAQNESLIASLAARGVKVREVSTFSSEGGGMRALMALGVAADVIGAPFEAIAETGWESVKFATNTGGVPTIFKEGFVASVEQHRKRSIAAQIGLGIVFDPFILAKVFTLPLKASKPALRAAVKSQLVELADNNGTPLSRRQIDGVVEEVIEQYQNPQQFQNPLGNFDDVDLSFDDLPPVGAGREPMGAAYRTGAGPDPDAAMRQVGPDVPTEEAIPPAAAAPSPAGQMPIPEEALDAPVAAVADDSQRQAVANKWATAKARNSANATTDLNKLKESGFDVGDAEKQLKEYMDTVQRDFESYDDFAEARTETWDNFVAALDDVESIDAGVPAAALEPAGAKNIRIKILEDQPRVKVVEEKPLSGSLPENGPPVAPTTGTHRAYHGTAQVFDAFAEGAQSSNALYGPGVYLTEDAGVASRYAITTGTRKPPTNYTGQPLDAFGRVLSDAEVEVLRAGGAPNVWSMDIRVNKFLDMDAPPNKELVDILKKLDDEAYDSNAASATLADGFEATEFNAFDELTTNHDLYQLLRGMFGDKAEVNDWLIANGYDTITHIGGARTGTNPHRVWISIDGETVSPAFGKNKPSAAAMIDAPEAAAAVGPPPAGAVPVPEEAIPTPRPAAAVPEGAVVPEQAVPEGQVIPEQVIPEEAAIPRTAAVPEAAPVRSEAAVKATDDFDAAAAKRKKDLPSNLNNERVVKKADDLVRVLDDEATNVAGLDDLRAAVDDYQSHRAMVKGNRIGGANKSTNPETVRRVQAVENAVANLGDEVAPPVARAAVPPPPAAVIEPPLVPSVEPSAAALEPSAMPVTPSVVEPTVERGAIGSWISSPDVANGAPVKVVGRHGSWDADGVYKAREFDVELPDGSTRRVQADNVQDADVEPAPDIGGAGRGADGEGPPPQNRDTEERFDEPGDPVPEADAPKLHQALENVATQMRMDEPGAFGQFLSLLPGISQIQHWLRPANKIAAHIMKAYIGQGAVRARLMTQMFAEREVVLYPLLREHFGVDSLTGAKMPSEIVQYIGSQDEFVEEIANTLLDVAQRPHLYSLNSAQQQALQRWQQYQMKFMNEIIDGYGAKVDIFEVADGSVFLSNVNVDDALLEALDINVAQAVGRGRNKHRFYNTAADRYLTIRRNVDEIVEERQRSLETALDRPLTTSEIEDLRSAVQAEKAKPFKALTSINDLQAGMDAWKARAAANQTFKVGSQGKTLMQVIDELHPGLRTRRDTLARQVKSLRDQITTAERQVMQEGGALRKITPELERAEERLNRLLGRIDEKFDEGVDIDYLSGQAHELLRNFKALEERGIIISERGATGVSKTTMMHERLEELVEELADVRRAYNAASKDDYVFVTEGGLFQYYHASDAKVIRDLHKSSDNMIIRGLEEIRGTAFAGDLSPLLGVQMPLAFMANPQGVVRALIGAVAGSAKSGDVLRSFRTGTLAQAVAEDLDGWLDFAFYSGREITAGTPQEFAGGLLRFLPGFNKLNESMYSIVLRQTKALYDQQLSILVKQGVSLEEAKATAADLALKVVPMWSPRRLGLAPGREAAVRAGVTSISFLTKPAEMMATASVGFAKLATKQTLSAQELLATRVVTTMGATWMSLAVTSAVLDAKAKGRDPWEAAKLAMTPNSGSFGTIKLVGSEKSIPMGGPIRGIVQAVAPRMKEINGVGVPVPFAGLPQFFMNRMTPGLRTQISLLMDRDFFGGKVTGYLKDPQSSTLGKILRGAAYEVEGLVPLTLGSAMGGIRRGLSDATDPMINASEIISDSLSQFGGVNMFVESPYTKGDYEARKWAKENGVRGYREQLPDGTLSEGTEIKRRKDLSPRDRKRFEDSDEKVKDEIQEHIKRMGLQKVPWAVTTYKAETTKVEFAGQQQVDDEQLGRYWQDGPKPNHDTGTTISLSPKKWIEQRRTRMTDLAARRDEIYENLDTQDPKNATDRYYQKFDEIKTKHNNQMSESAWEELDSWIENQSSYDQKWIEENTRLNALTPMVQEWYDDQAVLRGYWQLEDDFLDYIRETQGPQKGAEIAARWQRYKDAPDHSKHLHGMEEISSALTDVRRAYRVKDGTLASLIANKPGDTTKGKQVDIALAKWGYSGMPMSGEAREYLVGPMTPDFYNQPIGSTQAQPAAQPSQPQAQPSPAATPTQSMWQSFGGNVSTQPAIQPPTPTATATAPTQSMWQSFAGAR